jgi:hypothetical protein
VADPFKHGNEPSGSIKGGAFLGRLCNHQPLKNKFAPWSWFLRGAGDGAFVAWFEGSVLAFT